MVIVEINKPLAELDATSALRSAPDDKWVKPYLWNFHDYGSHDDDLDDHDGDDDDDLDSDDDDDDADDDGDDNDDDYSWLTPQQFSHTVFLFHFLRRKSKLTFLVLLEIQERCLCLCVCICQFFLFVGQVMYLNHSDQMSQRSQVFRTAFWGCSVIVFAFVPCLTDVN